MVLVVKNRLANAGDMRHETWVGSLGWEDLLEKGMATTLVLAPKTFHGQRSLAGYSSRGHKRAGQDRAAEHDTLPP